VERRELDASVLHYLLGSYGAQHIKILDLVASDSRLAEIIEPGLPFTLAEILYCARYEAERDVEDLIWRRSYRAFLGPLDQAARDRWEQALRWAKTQA